MKVSFLTNAPDFSLSVMDAAPLPGSPNPEGQKDNGGTRKLCAKFGGEGSLYLQAKWIPLTDPAADTPQQDVPLAQWSVPDGEKRKIPAIDMLYMNGEPMKEFDPTVAGYSVTMPLDAREVPVVSAEGTEAYEVEVQEAETPGETTYVRVTDREDPQLYRVYSVDFPYVRKLEDIAGRTRLPVFALEASEEPEKENIQDNVNDGDLKTRWAASGANQWVTLDLGSPQQVSAVGVAGWQGDARVYYCDVAVSDDNRTWTTVVSKAQSSGRAEQIEIFEFTPVTARYVRLIGNGNSVNAWNSILEFAALQ